MLSLIKCPFLYPFRYSLQAIFLITFSTASYSCFAALNSNDKILLQIKDLELKSVALSPDLKIIKNLKSEKKAESYTKLSAFIPQASLLIKREKDFYSERNAPLRALGLQTYDSSWGINYQWTLFDYGLSQSMTKVLTESEKVDLDLTIKEREFTIAYNSNLLNLLLAKYKKAAVENSLKKADTGKKEAKIGFELGEKTKLDLLRSEANMVSLDSKKISFIDEEQNAKSKFLEFSGLDEKDIPFLDNLEENQILSLIDSLSSTSHSSNTINEKINYGKSPILLNLNFEEKINKLSLSAITQNNWPNLKIQGNYQNAGNSFSESLDSPFRTHSIALVLTIPLFGGGNSASTYFQEYFAKKQLEYTITKKKLETKNQLENTFIKIKALNSLVLSLGLNVSQFEELYKLTLKSYQLGKSSYLELLEVQDNLLNSKMSLAQNKILFFTLSQNYLWQAGLL